MIFVFDVFEQNSFDSIDEWIGDVERHAGSDITKVLLGKNKTQQFNNFR